MLKQILNVIASAYTTITLLVLYALIIAAATIIEKFYGTAIAKEWCYYSTYLLFIQLVLIANFCLMFFRRGFKYVKLHWWTTISHTALIIIVIGSVVSHFCSEEGFVHLRIGAETNDLYDNGRGYFLELPFSLKLEDFTIERYVGSGSPSSYKSKLLITTNERSFTDSVWVNHVLNIDGYRLFQSSFDADENGSTLTINHDVWGNSITYIGYFLLFVGLLSGLFAPQSRLLYLLQKLKNKKSALFIVLLVMSASLSAQQSISLEHSERFGSLPMQSVQRGRIVPVNTFASELLRKVSKRTSYDNLSENQLLLAILSEPNVWADKPLIAIPNSTFSKQFGLGEKYAAYNDFFDKTSGKYILTDVLNDIYNTPAAARNGFDKAVLKVDESVNILFRVFSGEMLNIFPVPNEKRWCSFGDDLSAFSGQDSLFVSQIFHWYLDEVLQAQKSGNWDKPNEILDMIKIYQTKRSNVEISESALRAELLYNSLNIFGTCKKIYLICGGLLLIIVLISMISSAMKMRLPILLLSVVLVLAELYQIVGFGLRWRIGGYAPWSNSYETMVFVAFATVFAGTIFIRKSKLTFALSALFGGVILFVAGLNNMDPQIGTLVPVLKSPWLMFHVAVIVAAYGFYGISTLISITILGMFSAKKRFEVAISELAAISEASLIIGTVLMTIGTFLGAIWANESWGRYWGWDPKESWALVTLVVYAAIIHLHLSKRWYTPFIMSLLTTFAFLTVLMTYFGVNMFLSGMHSYGG